MAETPKKPEPEPFTEEELERTGTQLAQQMWAQNPEDVWDAPLPHYVQDLSGPMKAEAQAMLEQLRAQRQGVQTGVAAKAKGGEEGEQETPSQEGTPEGEARGGAGGASDESAAD